MADERKAPRKWSLEEIDELLQDSGMLPREEDTISRVEEIVPAQKAAAFNPRPSHNDKIEHRIRTQTIERSDSVAEPQVYGNFVSEKYRDRFFNKPMQNLQKTAEHTIVPPEEQKYERGGFVKKQSNFTPTAEFSPVPNLVPDHKFDTKIASGKTMVFDDKQHTKTIGLRSLAVTDGDAHDIELPDDEENLQLSLEGFHAPDGLDTVDEREVEAELLRKRKETVSSFTIASDAIEPDTSDEVKRYGTDEYRTPDDKFKVAYYLKKKKNTALAGAVISMICAFFLAVISLVAKGFTDGGRIFAILSLALTIVPVAVNISTIADGVKVLKKLKFNRFTGSFIAILATVIQNVVLMLYASPFEKGVSIFSAVAVISLGLNMIGEYYELGRISRNFNYMISREENYSVAPIEKTEVAFEIGRGLLLEDPSVLCSQKTLFPRRFIELSRRYYPSDDISAKLTPLGIGVSVLIGAITLLISKDIRTSVTAFSGCVCLCVPYFSALAESIAISKISRKSCTKGAMIAGWEALKMCENANAVAVDSADIFDSEGGNVFGIHPFYDIGIDEAIIYTASLLVASGGPLGNLFKRVIVGEVSLLPPVDTLAYEDKLGLSAWIFNRRVLVGSKDLLRNHNVEIPNIALVERHLTEGRYPLYLAIDGKAAAAFIVSYDIEQSNAKYLKDIESNSISLLVRSDDANITDEMVAGGLDLPLSGVKVLSAVSGDLYKTYTGETTSSADALLIHDGKTKSLLRAIRSALSLGSFKRVLNLIQICAMGIGVALVGTLSLVSGLEHLNCLELIITQGFFTALAIFVVSGSFTVKNFEGKKK